MGKKVLVTGGCAEVYGKASKPFVFCLFSLYASDLLIGRRGFLTVLPN
jgi:hypothetical protein